MIKLTEKCLDAFGDKCKYNYEEFMELPESCKNALIIEFFDSVGIWEEIFEIEYLNNTNNFKITCDQAIEKANIIYNESKL